MTSFNRMRRLQEQKKKTQKVSDADIKTIQDLCEKAEVPSDKIKEVVKALKSGLVTPAQLMAELDDFISKKGLEDNPPAHGNGLPDPESVDLSGELSPDILPGSAPEAETCSQEEAEKMIESGEAEIPSEAVVNEAEMAQESAPLEAEEAPAAPKSKKKKNA